MTMLRETARLGNFYEYMQTQTHTRKHFFSISLYPLMHLSIRNVYFSTDSSIDLDCSLGNDDANYLLQQQSTTLQLPNQQHSTTPFGMDLSVEFGHSSNRSSIVSQVFPF